MNKRLKYSAHAGQAAMEYLLMLGVMVVIALTAFRTMIPAAVNETEGHFNLSVTNIIGNVARTSISGPFPR